MLMLGGKDTSFKSLKKESFPQNATESFEHVLRCDVGSIQRLRTKYLYEDRLKALGTDTNMKPWKRVWGHYNHYEIRPFYRTYTNQELDPLRRFHFKEIKQTNEYIFKRWFVDQNINAKMGVFFEACFACNAIKKEACFNCKCRNSLRWCGASGSSWKDLVCTVCEW